MPFEVVQTIVEGILKGLPESEKLMDKTILSAMVKVSSDSIKIPAIGYGKVDRAWEWDNDWAAISMIYSSANFGEENRVDTIIRMSGQGIKVKFRES